MMRDYQRIKSLKDFSTLDAPVEVDIPQPMPCPYEEQKILRMLVRPKYGPFIIPHSLLWLEQTIRQLARYDYHCTGIEQSWCYVTVRHGEITTKTDDEWHFDGASFRTGLIPERNYIWANNTPTEYKLGSLVFPNDFDPNKHNLFSFAEKALADYPVQRCKALTWYLLNPFCFHRRDPKSPVISRTFLRVSFPDIEGRDVNNTENPLLKTPAWGRDPVREFRDKLTHY